MTRSLTSISHPRRDRGYAAIEVLILVPVIFALVNVAVYAGKIRMAHSIVRAAAQEAAREASISRVGSDSSINTPTIAATVLGKQGRDLLCFTSSETWHDSNGSPFDPNNIGKNESVSVTVSCQIYVRMLGNLGVGKYITITESAMTVIDKYRSRQP